MLLLIKKRKNRAYLCAGSVICVSLLRAPQYSTFACCLIPVLTLVVLLVMLDDIDDISFSKRRYFLIVSWMSISVYCIPTRDTHITRDMCTGIHISRGYTYHCDTGNGTVLLSNYRFIFSHLFSLDRMCMQGIPDLAAIILVLELFTLCSGKDMFCEV